MLSILHFSSHHEDCGIARYQEHYIEALNSTASTENSFFEYSPYQTRDMNPEQFSKVIDKLRAELPKHQIFHLQHEFGFYRNDQLEQLIRTAKEAGLKTVVTYHTSPDLIIIKKRLTGLGPRSLVSYARSRRHNEALRKIHIAPLLVADRVLVHNQYTANQLMEFGVPESLITIVPHPTYGITHPPKTSTIAAALQKQKGDIIIGTVGYIHRFKGVDKAIKSLSYLPNNYKLAILGGVKSDSDDQKLYDKIADLIIELGLKERVYITGVVPSDEDLNSFIRETDICVYPYDSRYYKGVASGALNLAIANERPIVAYPVTTFVETNQEFGHIMFTGSDSYYELAREVQRLDVAGQTKKIKAYAKANSFNNTAKGIASIYKSL